MKRVEYCPQCQDSVLVVKQLIKSNSGVNKELCTCPKCGGNLTRNENK